MIDFRKLIPLMNIIKSGSFSLEIAHENDIIKIKVP